MTVTDRDKRIIKDIERFRALDRDQIGELHFSGNKQQVKTVNFVMNRLKKRGYVKADDSRSPFVYLPHKGGPRRGSQKVDHFIEIANVYLKLRKTGKLRHFTVEPKLGSKGTIEPDIFAIWKGWPLFIEVQLSNYSDTIMRHKLKRYEAYYKSGQWKGLSWQPKEGKQLFPVIWIISSRQYDVSWFKSVTIYQTKTVEELL